VRTAARAAGLLAVLFAALVLSGCTEGSFRAPDVSGRDVRVVTTTNFITDLARQVGGDRVQVTGLMGPGVDPHLYKASARDVRTLRQADLVLYGGLDLEGKMDDVFEELGRRRPVTAVTDGIPRAKLLDTDQADETYDPHVWFDVSLWMDATREAARALTRVDPAGEATYRANAEAYLRELRALDREVAERIAAIPRASRVLVTSHDAFRYFGRRYGLEVVAIQGISTATEATTADIERVAAVVAERRLKGVFLESSVPQQTIDAVLDAARDRGQPARIGGELYTDAAGDEGTPEGTYAGMVRANVTKIAEALQ
jgi:manganese/zinc/iron transport system substrate-binding protein